VEYQPIVDLQTRRWIGAEALVRWRRPDGRIIRPDNFIPVAEQSGVIQYVTECVAEIVAADLPSLIAIDPKFRVAINVSARDLGSEHTLAIIRNLLRNGRAHPENIAVEATERGFLQGNEAREVLAGIRGLGVEVAIDDFGTGYSSLSSLQTLNVDALKIDKSFVDTIGTDAATSHVVSHIIEMAHSLQLIIVAEGVETDAQAEYLQRRGVHYAQGWLFAVPMPVSALRAGIQEQAELKQNQKV
jgi:sensor c-di-GMP phosphodiesterase-like protein